MSLANDYQYNVIGQVLIEKVLPTLAKLMEEAATELAIQQGGSKPTILDRDDAGQMLVKGLADLLIFAYNDLDDNYPMITLHQLQDTRYAAAWFDVNDSGYLLTPPAPGEAEAQ
jgi:hypothetical protein